MQENGIKVLTNEKAVPVQGIEVYGVGDLRSAEFQPEKVLPKEEKTTQAPFRVVMSHNPDSAKVLSNYPVDLIVSGHSHGGFKKFRFLLVTFRTNLRTCISVRKIGRS